MIRKLILLFLVLLLLFSMFTIQSITTVSSVNIHRIKIGAYYYGWYGKGLGSNHWNDTDGNVVMDTPVKGFYDSQDLSTVNWQLEKMEYVGIDFIIVSWWGINSYTDNSTKILFSLLDINYSIQAVIMVEPFNQSSGDYNFQTIYDYIYNTYVDAYPHVYMKLYTKPLICFYNEDVNMTKNGNLTLDSRFTVRILGHQNYTNWVYWSFDVDKPQPWIPRDQPLCIDGQINVCPRYDDYYQRMPYHRFDIDYSEDLYGKQWSNVISLAKQGKVNIVTISTWNEYHERTQIEPCVDMTSAYEQNVDYILEKTKSYIEQLRSAIYCNCGFLNSALNFVEAQLHNYADDKWLCSEFPRSYRYWIYNDNYLAYKILEYFNRNESAGKIKTTIESYGISLEGNDRLEVLFNQTIPFPPYTGTGMNFSPIIDSYQNVIANPSVENGECPNCTDWYNSSIGAYWNNQTAYTGSKSLLLNVSDNVADWRCRAFEVLANKTYVFQGWIKGSASNGEFFITLRWWRDVNATDFISEVNIPIPLGHYEKWRLIENETTAPSETMAADVQFRCPTNSTGELFGDDFLVINISNEESFIVRNDEKHIQIPDWKEYADLLLFGVIDRYRGNSTYKDLWNKACKMFDGKGMADKVFDGTKYETYKLALFVIASRIINNQTIATNCALSIIWKMQDESNGGVTTHYLPDLTPDPKSTQNVETTCLAIYATITDVIPEFPSFLIMSLFMLATLVIIMYRKVSSTNDKSTRRILRGENMEIDWNLVKKMIPWNYEDLIRA